MTNDELKIQLALGTIKWYQLTEDDINDITDIELIDMVYGQIVKDKPSVFDLVVADCNRVYIYRRKIELTKSL